MSDYMDGIMLCGHFGWFHIKIPKEFGGACFVCVLDVISLGSTNMEVCFLSKSV